MRTQRQDYKDSDYETARKAGCDTLQLKYDGWWTRVEIIHGQGRLYTQTDRELPQFAFQLQVEPINAVLVGELMFGTQWSQPADRQGKIFLFDAWQVDDNALEGLDYKTRYAVLRTLQGRLPPQFQRIQNFQITDYKKIWSQFVETGDFEGVVFRDSKATVAPPIHRQKNIITDDACIVGFIEGLPGKHEGRLGALVCRLPNGTTQDVGGGIDDRLREEIWQNQDTFRGRWCQIEGRARFASGALRHPNLVGLRPLDWKPS